MVVSYLKPPSVLPFSVFLFFLSIFFVVFFFCCADGSLAPVWNRCITYDIPVFIRSQFLH